MQINDFTVGVFKTKEKKYYANEFKGDYEIVSLTGTINTMNGEYYSHMHLSAGNDQGEVFGGHLNKAIVSATCEMVIQVINGQVDRYFDEENWIKFIKIIKELTMEYLTLPQTDLKVSKIALGCMRIADKSIEEVEELVKNCSRIRN